MKLQNPERNNNIQKNGMQKPKLILVDDHIIFRQGIKNLLVNEEIAEVIGEADNGKEFLEILKNKNPDLVLMDISMPQMNGVEATRIALQENPSLKILALSAFGDELYYYRMIDAGVKGFVMKDTGLKELELAINEVSQGKSYFSNELLRRIVTNIGKKPTSSKFNVLTPRETEVLHLICNGFTNEEIAKQLFISPETIKGHRSKILSKTGCRNTASLVMYALKNKLIEV